MTFLQFIKSLNEDDAWYIQDFTWQDPGEQIALGFLEGQAVVVSNGSYKECKGAAGWVIEVANNSGRIIGSTIVSDMHIDTHLKI